MMMMTTMTTVNTSCSTRRVLLAASAVLVVVSSLAQLTQADDKFNYRSTNGDDYGPDDWSKVDCKDLDDCEGWPDKHLASIGWELDKNMCLSCPDIGKQDGKCDHTHRMSPVDLLRDRAIQDGKNWKECPDWHWMNFEDGTCTWNDMKNSFKIARHALQMEIPMRDNGDIDCVSETGFRKYPRLDYSKGFPDWWHLDRTEIKVPSEHTQHGKRYAAEVVLSHFYEKDHYKNQIGYVSIFMQDYPGEEPWHYLDKLICAWRLEEEKQREACGLPPAPVYKMCALFRGQTRSFEDFEFFQPDDGTTTSDSTTVENQETGQLQRPDPIPIQDFGSNPDSSLMPLQLCQGDCDFDEDCAPGLICHRREAFGPVPGCIGGEEDAGTNDYCVFDPFGSGYAGPVQPPTPAPTITARPTFTQPAPIPLVDWSGTPPIEAVPLQRCHGDCDTDADCAPGLICFQRSAFQAIPGCVGGETLDKMSDFCIVDPLGDGSFVDSGFVAPTEENTAAVPTEIPTALATSLTPPTDVPTPLDETVSSQTTSPTATSTVQSSTDGSLKQIENLGWEPAFKLDECQGDCDTDDDCMDGLVCFDREVSMTPVPGCAGGESDFSLTDYCIRAQQPVLPELGGDETVISRVDTAAPTSSPSSVVAAAPTSSPSVPIAVATGSPTEVVPTQSVPISSDAVPLNPVGWSPPAEQKPLGVCQGDCDTDDDCAGGLVCFQRTLPGAEVPGCIGGTEDFSLMDYCIVDPATISTTVDAPISALAPSDPPLALTFQNSVPVATTPDGFDCSAFNGQVTSSGTPVSIDRLCDPHPDECCQNPRSDSNYCHEMYNFFGTDMTAVCGSCCIQSTRGESLRVGPPNTPKDGLEPYTECHMLENSARFCKDDGCCSTESSDTVYCQEQFALHLGDVERICWYCCHPSKTFSPPSTRQLEADAADNDLPPVHTAMTRNEMIEYYNDDVRPLGEGDKFFHDSIGRKLIVRAENFEPKTTVEEDEAKFNQVYEAHLRRELQTSVAENYDDVYWWPYEWLLKVGAEYYFRYEGSMTVPPCYTVNHWRVVKDPIRVATHQIQELERLLAWRLNSQCQSDTAGRPREGNPDAVDVTRPLQKLERGHRMTFCECQDWPSKFPAERQWCRKWQERDPEIRLFQNPYNWEQQGF